MYLDKGPLYYYDKIMSVYNITGKGTWSGLSQSEKQKAGMMTQYKLNKYFNYRYDRYFSEKVTEAKQLEKYKSLFGTRLGWELWYHMEFRNNKWMVKQLVHKMLQKSRKDE
jgi:hypothetical protein